MKEESNLSRRQTRKKSRKPDGEDRSGESGVVESARRATRGDRGQRLQSRWNTSFQLDVLKRVGGSDVAKERGKKGRRGKAQNCERVRLAKEWEKLRNDATRLGRGVVSLRSFLGLFKSSAVRFSTLGASLLLAFAQARRRQYSIRRRELHPKRRENKLAKLPT